MLKKIILSPFLFLESLVDRIIAVAGALLFAQFPQFFVQYLQRLGGHRDELERVVDLYLDAAKTSGETIESYIGLHLKSAIPEFVKTGKIMEQNFERFRDLGAALKELTTCGPWTKFFVFLKNIDLDIAGAALKNFVPGIPLSGEGFAYAALGLVFFMLVYYLLKKAVCILIKKVAGTKRIAAHGRG